MTKKSACPKCGQEGTIRIKHIITDVEYYCINPNCGWFKYVEV